MLGSNVQITIAGRMGFYPNGTIAALTPRPGGFISDGILAANVVRDGATDFVNLVEAFGKESDSACSFR
jgi:hypothetical protein